MLFSRQTRHPIGAVKFYSYIKLTGGILSHMSQNHSPTRVVVSKGSDVINLIVDYYVPCLVSAVIRFIIRGLYNVGTTESFVICAIGRDFLRKSGVYLDWGYQ
jgi:hypothetical protein